MSTVETSTSITAISGHSRRPAFVSVKVHPLVAYLGAELKLEARTWNWLALRSGYARSTLWLWRSGRKSPRLAEMDCCLQLLGKRLSVVSLEAGE